MLATDHESENTLGGQSIQQRDGSNKERCDDAATIDLDVEDNLTQSIFTSEKDIILMLRKDVLLVLLELFVWFGQLEFLPGIKIVRVKISEDNDCTDYICLNWMV